MCGDMKMNTTYSPSQTNALYFQAVVLSSSFQYMLYDSSQEVVSEMIEAFLPFHAEMGVGEDILRQILEDLANGEAGAIRNFAGHLIRSNTAFTSLWGVIYGT